VLEHQNLCDSIVAQLRQQQSINLEEATRESILELERVQREMAELTERLNQVNPLVVTLSCKLDKSEAELRYDGTDYRPMLCHQTHNETVHRHKTTHVYIHTPHIHHTYTTHIYTRTMRLTEGTVRSQDNENPGDPKEREQQDAEVHV
jgi:hypothetical protein